MARRHKLEMSFEIERGSSTVEYVCEFEVSPYDPGRTSGPPENCYPPEGGEVEDKAVYIETVKPCADHRASWKGRDGCRSCKRIRERREELDDLVSDEELLEHAGEQDDGPDPDDERDRRRDDEYDRRHERD